MNIGIISLSKKERGFSEAERRLRDEARRLGHKAEILKSKNFLQLFNTHVDLKYGKQSIRKFDVFIPRANISESIALEGSILKQIEHMHIPIVNTYDAIVRAKNKLLTLQILTANGIPTLRTAIIQSTKNLNNALKYIGGFPMIMKTAFGSFGEGVALIETHRSAISAYDLLNRTPNNIILLQKYIKESKGKDIRVFIVGGKFVAAMQRSAKPGDFRSNVKAGGEGEPVEVSREIKNLAIKATKAIGLEISGVDVILTSAGPAIMEVNANPGFTGLETTTGVNVAEAMVKYAVRFANQYIPAPPTL